MSPGQAPFNTDNLPPNSFIIPHASDYFFIYSFVAIFGQLLKLSCLPRFYYQFFAFYTFSWISSFILRAILLYADDSGLIVHN